MRYVLITILIATVLFPPLNVRGNVGIREVVSFEPGEEQLKTILLFTDLLDRVKDFGILSNGYITVVSIRFFYGPFYEPDKTKIVKDLNTFSMALIKLIFLYFPKVDEIDLSGIYRDKIKITFKEMQPTFTASIRRRDFDRFYTPGIDPAVFFNRLNRVYYDRFLLAYDLVGLKRDSLVVENTNRNKQGPAGYTGNVVGRLKSLLMRGLCFRTGRIISNTIYRGNPKLKEIALTFDDGPKPLYLPLLLDLLRRYNVPSTFFIVGHQGMIYPYFLRDIVVNGNELGNHTFDHLNLPLLSDRELKYQINQTQELIKKTIGIKCRYFRPPGGDYDDRVTKVLSEDSLLLVMWSSAVGDYAVTSRKDEEILKRKLRNSIYPGSIILLHVGVKADIFLLPGFIKLVREKGYKIVPLEKLIRDSLLYKGF
ncbi:MAG: polysaccharide deacetylase family protein [bacterium]